MDLLYRLEREVIINAAHVINMPAVKSKHEQLHGHTWKITVICETEDLDKNNMILDYTVIDDFIKEKFDHQVLNTVPELKINPTCEKLAKMILLKMPYCIKVIIENQPGLKITVRKDEIDLITSEPTFY